MADQPVGTQNDGFGLIPVHHHDIDSIGVRADFGDGPGRLAAHFHKGAHARLAQIQTGCLETVLDQVSGQPAAHIPQSNDTCP